MAKNIYLAEIDCYIQATSTTSRTIGTGSHTLTLASNIVFVPGMSVTADAGSGNTMTGTVTSYDQATKALVINVTSVAGSGTFASWTIGGTTTLRYSSGRGYNRPTASGYYDPRIIQPCNMQRTMFATGTTGGPMEVGYGLLILNNGDGGLDPLLEYGFDGRKLTIKIGDESSAYSSFTTLMVGTIEQPEFSYSSNGSQATSQVSFRLRDRLEELRRKPIQTTKYAGSNSLPNGLEGTADDLKGRPKPRAYGRCRNVAPFMVNTTRLIYQFNTGSGADVDAVYVKALALTQGADYTDQTDMEANAPGANQFRVWPGGGYFRLGTNPAGLVSCDVLEGANDGERTAAQILKRIATTAGGIDAGDVNSSDVTALDTANSAVLGIWLPDEIQCIDAMSMVAQSVGAWFGFDRLGKLRMARLSAPTGSAAITLKSFMRTVPAEANTGDIISIDRVPTNDEGRGVPISRVVLRYKRSWAQQQTDLDATVTAAQKAFVSQEWREATTSEDATVKAKHLLAVERIFSSLFDVEAAATTEASRLLDLHKVRRDRWRVGVKWDASIAATVDLGTKLDLKISRFGLNAGKGFIVIGITNNAENDTAELDLWG